MTDGIIQKVFNEIINNCKSFPNTTFTNANIAEGLEEMKQELIEEIKKIEKENNKYEIYNCLSLEDLIGDNE